MKRVDAFKLYVDYLIAENHQATATGLSNLTDNALKHDYISDALADPTLNGKTFWKFVKSFAREIESEDSVLSIDDTLSSKPHSSVNTIVNYHFDHSQGRTIKGINILNFLLSSSLSDNTMVNCPVGFEVIVKDQPYQDKEGNKRFKSLKTKNELVLEKVNDLIYHNRLKFKYILFDSWFSASDTLKQIHQRFKKYFICPLKQNRLVALSEKDKFAGKFVKVSTLEINKNQTFEVYIKGLDFPVKLVKQVFINKDYSEGVLYLVTNELSADYQRITTTYQKRWKVEEFHKSMKQNTLLSKSPTKMEVTQRNHIFASMLAYIELERLKIKEKLNHFALMAKLRLKMLKAALQELNCLKMA